MGGHAPAGGSIALVDSYDSGGYLVFVWSPNGYVLETRAGEPPKVGAVIENGERRFRVTKIAPSPLPGDGRVCAYLLPA
jgi:hypothetical protein